jgi:hypothetical protein
MTVETNAPQPVIPAPEKMRPNRSMVARWGWKVVIPALVLALAASAVVMWIMQPSAPAEVAQIAYRPVSGGFAATAPSIPGYNAPYQVVAGVPAGGGFAATVPSIPGYNAPYPKLTSRPGGGGFASTAPLIPGYNIPYNMPPNLWRIITTRAGFDVYEGRPAVVVSAAGDGSAQR